MRARLPPLNPLKAFEAFARHKSVAGAAQELSVTQSAISHQIRSLERSLGVDLFRRNGRRLDLTPPGSVLFSEVSAAFELIVGATSRLQKPTADGDLSINCVPAFLFYWLLPRLGDLKKRLPGIRVKLVSSNSSGGNYSPDTDVSIRYGDGNWPDHWVRLLSSLDLFPVISPSLAMSSPIRATDDLRNHTLLHADQGQEWSDWLTAIGVRNLVCAQDQFLSDAQIALEASIHGYGVALGDQFIVGNALSSGRLLAPFEVTIPAVHSLYIVCGAGLQTTSIVKEFLDWIYEKISEKKV